MNSINNIFKKAVIRGRAHYLIASDAIELIKICKMENRGILGIDTFIITETTTQPISEESIDYSLLGKNYQKWNEAINFIEQRKMQGYYFEVVFEEN